MKKQQAKDTTTQFIWQKAALKEYNSNYPLYLKQEQTHFGSCMQCYCKTPENFAPHTKFELD